MKGEVPSPPAEGKGSELQTLAPDPFEKQAPTAVLDKRLTLRLPDNARIEPRSHSIMAAPQPNEEETRVVLDAGGERFVIMAYELFARGGADPAHNVRAAVDKDFDAPKPKVEPLRLADEELKAWAVFPATVDRSRSAILVLSVYVLHPDGFVQLLDFYVNPPAASGDGCTRLVEVAKATGLPKMQGELPTCTALAHAIASTLGAGARRLDVSAGERKLAGQYGDDSFFAKVPGGASITVQPGPDFTVHHLRLPVELGASQPTLGIYVGGHPSFQYHQHDVEVKPTERPGKVFGQQMKWQVWAMSPERVMAEAIVPHPKSQDTMVHIFASAENEKALTPLLDIAATLRLP